MTKTITKSDWAAMRGFKEPTATTGRIRKDDNGNLWEWKESGKRVTVKGIDPKTLANVRAQQNQDDETPPERFATTDNDREIFNTL